MSATREFVRESNRIEGYTYEPTDAEVEVFVKLLRRPTLDLGTVEAFVSVIAAARLRDQVGMDVRVGSHIPPRGGPEIRERLRRLLDDITQERLTPHAAHIAYETLHPFMDGNGRSGRAVWAWQMARDGHDPFALPFLHRFYYQTLDASGR